MTISADPVCSLTCVPHEQPRAAISTAGHTVPKYEKVTDRYHIAAHDKSRCIIFSWSQGKVPNTRRYLNTFVDCVSEMGGLKNNSTRLVAHYSRMLSNRMISLQTMPENPISNAYSPPFQGASAHVSIYLCAMQCYRTHNIKG